MNITRLTYCLLLAACMALTGCAYEFWHEAVSSHTNPVAGWQVDFKSEPSQAVQKDVQDYISKLPGMQKYWTGPQQWLTDGKGQHALVFPVALNGTDWGHVLIYDQHDKRIRVIKYVMGNYRS